MPTETALALVNTGDQMRLATDAAGVCKDIVTRTAMTIQGRSYVKVEGWMAIANAHGCVASARDVERIEGGFRCVGEIRRATDGRVIAQGEGFVGEDEPTWFGGGPKNLAKRPDYAIRAMCQTRAISRACRTAFAHVVVLMNANLETTPAEEMPHDVETTPAPRNVTPAPAAAPAAGTFRRLAPNPSAAPTQATGSWKEFRVPPFIKKYVGGTLGDMNEKDLIWWANNYEPKPYQGAIQDKDRDLQAALRAGLAEIQGVRLTNGARGMPHNEAEAANVSHGAADSDVPFGAVPDSMI